VIKVIEANFKRSVLGTYDRKSACPLVVDGDLAPSAELTQISLRHVVVLTGLLRHQAVQLPRSEKMLGISKESVLAS
jgi:hypothetical protein